MMTDDTEREMLAPLDELIAILPEIEKAKERARLGAALQKATTSAQKYDWMPVRLQDLSALLAATDHGDLRAELGPSVEAIIKTSHTLASDASIDELDNVNQSGMVQLPLQIEKINERIEDLWRLSVRQNLGGHAALGDVLNAIPGVASLGRDLTTLAVRARTLEDVKRRASDRVAQRDALVREVAEVADRLLKAGVAPPVANFLVAIAANPVPLSDLTEEIFAWIRDHDALALFSVSARARDAAI